MAPAQSDSGLLGQLARIGPDISQLRTRGGDKGLVQEAPALISPEVVGGQRSRERKSSELSPSHCWLPEATFELLRSQGNPVGEQQGLGLLPRRDGCFH